jgi:hypothetical protein
MKISKPMVKYYLRYITLGYLGEADEPPGDVEGFDDYIDNARAVAQKQGDLPWFKLALEHLLTDPNVNLKEYTGGQYPYSADRMRELLAHTWSRLWPDESFSAPGRGVPVELVDMSEAEWAAYRKQ